jgi:D-alanine-D-alanine ligase
MAKNRIGVLYEYTWEDEAQSGHRPPRQRPEPDVREVYEALKAAGHRPVYLRADGTRESLQEIADARVDLIFNLVESFAGDDTQDRNVAGFLELLGVPFTGAGSDGLYLAQDKSVAKKIFAHSGLHTPYFATVDRGRTLDSMDVHFTLIVKPAREDGSIGIHFGAVCNSIKELMDRIDYVQSEFDCPVLIEEYIEGRELYVSILGNEDPEALPTVEISFEKLPEGTPHIAGHEVKWEEGTQVYRDTPPFLPSDIDPKLQERIDETCIKAYQLCHARDYGRIDLRVTDNGAIHVLEVNPNPYQAEFAMAARKSGRTYTQLIDEIVDLALARSEDA